MSSDVTETTCLHLTLDDYSATFMPGRGMNFVSLKKGEVEAIDQSTRSLFEERFAGLGAMIGPHFHRRNPAVIPQVKGEERFPHIARVKAQGSAEPFSHGIGRYAPWKVEEASETRIKAVLRGEDQWHNISLKDLEGQDFTMNYTAELTPDGLQISLAVRSETESVVGLHTYYALTDGTGTVSAPVRDHYNDQGVLKPIPSTWNYEAHRLIYPASEPCDFGFQPFPDSLHGMMDLETGNHRVQVNYWSDNEENSIQMWHPQGASFMCMEPLSAKDPRKPKLTVSRIKILISVL
ncbi:MAG: hypothetical protein S4CHLAM2_13890 [Chlamydiales bacterium]|nr:hypothetical protein [Chlamydiales bacterium]